ncbi:hypothetical protein Hanom_Chr15g01381951 [Helianthus anomalus]
MTFLFHNQHLSQLQPHLPNPSHLLHPQLPTFSFSSFFSSISSSTTTSSTSS